MVMAFTREQASMNKRHDDAWADMYRRYPDLSHEERRGLFSNVYPDVNPDFEYPTRVPLRRAPESADHRRHVKIPEPFNDDVARLLDTEDFNLYTLIGSLLNTNGQLTDQHIPQLQDLSEKIDILSQILFNLPHYDAEFLVNTEKTRIFSHREAIDIVDQSKDTPGPVTSYYLEGCQGETEGLYHVFSSSLPTQLAEIAASLVEFLDEVITMLREDQEVHIERDIAT